MSDYVLGLDPGQKGAAVLLHKGNPVYSFEFRKCMTKETRGCKAEANLLSPKMVLTELLLVHDMMKRSQPEKSPDIRHSVSIALEVPLALPGTSLQSIATSHANWGQLLATLRLTYPDAPLEFIHPKAWTTALWLKFCRDPHSPDPKAKSKECFLRMWPKYVIASTEGSRDAALIAFYHAWKSDFLQKK